MHRVSDDEGPVKPEVAARARPIFATEEHRHALERHYAAAFGIEPRLVLHEQRSFGVHVDTYVYEATQARPYVTMATIGMSARAMTPPEDIEEHAGEKYSHAECLIYLVSDWDFDSALGDVPDDLLRTVARIAHITDSWIFHGHTVEAPGQNLVPGTLLTDIMVRWAPEPPSFQHLILSNGEACHFFWAVPITPAECYVARTHGAGTTIEHLDAAEYHTLDVDRACLVSAENRSQARARKKAQRVRKRMPRTTTVEKIRCNLHEHNS